MIDLILIVAFIGIYLFILIRKFNQRKNESMKLRSSYIDDTDHLITDAYNLLKLEKFNDVIKIADDILIDSPISYDALILRAMSLEALNFNLDAIDDFNKAISIKATDSNIMGLLGLLYKKIGDWNNAEVYLKKSVEMGDTNYEGNYKVMLITPPLAKQLMIENSTKPNNFLRRERV